MNDLQLEGKLYEIWRVLITYGWIYRRSQRNRRSTSAFSFNENQNRVMDQSSILSLCPSKVSFKASLYTSGEVNVYDFIGQSIVPVMKNIRSVLLSTSFKKEVFWSVSSSQELCEIYKSFCNQALSCRKKIAMDQFLNLSEIIFQWRQIQTICRKSLLERVKRNWMGIQKTI